MCKTEQTTGVEIGKIGKDSVKVTKGTIVKVDSGAKTVVVKTADGTEKTFDFTENAGKDYGQGRRYRHRKGSQGDGVLHGREWKEDCPLLWILTIAFKCKDAGTSRILRTVARGAILGSMILASVY